jgi:translationally controlled tumor-related protein
MKNIKEKLPEDRVADFEKGAQAYAKKIVASFKDYDFVGLSQLFFPQDPT